MSDRRKVQFSTLIFEPDRARGERVNIGLVAYDGENTFVRLTTNLAKTVALNPGFNPATLRKLPARVAELVGGGQDREMVHNLLSHGLGPVRALPERGEIFLGPQDNLEQELRELMGFICDTRRTATRVKVPRTRLFSDLRRLFKQSGVLGEHVADVAHRLVPNFPINEEAELYAEFAVKNGVFHVTETIDVRAVSRSKLNEAGTKALLFHESLARLGNDTKRYAIVAADHWKEASPLFALLEPYCDHLIDFRDGNAMNDYLSAMSKATGRQLQSLQSHGLS